ncbi:MAG TPA: hypothetical protein VIA06_23810 [Candidatus Dormibacteraeota bacterium]|jgi:hypothetical protein|nr:hypothetical protein [Candidatus Dormibacteraeota bacterium]
MRTHEPTGPQYLVCYGLFVCVLGLSVAVFFAWQGVFDVGTQRILGNVHTARVVYPALCLAMGVALLAVVMAGEYALRKALERGRLRRRFLSFAVPLVVIAVVGVLAHEAFLLTLG